MTLAAQIDRLNLEGYANLDAWVADLDKRVEQVLVERLRTVVETWCALLSADAEPLGESTITSPITSRTRDRSTTANPDEQRTESGLVIRPVTHEIRIRNQVIYLDPPIEHARADWYGQLQEWLGVVCCLKRIQSSRYEIGLKIHTSSFEEAHYTSLVRASDSLCSDCRVDVCIARAL